MKTEDRDEATSRLRRDPQIRPRVLVVDDDPEIVALLLPAARAIAPDLRIDWAETLGQAAYLIGRSRYDLVLADWHLGNSQSGLDLAPLVEFEQPSASFAVMTGDSIGKFMLEAGPGPWNFMSKPFSPTATRGFFASVLP